MEIVQERLEREFNLDLIASAPSVEYRVQLTMDRGWVNVDNPAKFPDVGEIESIEEPWVKLGVVTPDRYIGALMELTTGRRGTFENMEYLDPQRVHMHFELPLAELIVDYYDQLKSRTQGYASMDYEETGYRAANLVKLDVLVNGEPVDALSLIVHRDRAQTTGRQLAAKLKELIPRQMFEVPGPGGHRQPRRRAGDHPGDAQERPREVLRWRHHPQAEAAREAEGRKAADEARGIRGDPAGGLPRDPAHGRGMTPAPVAAARPMPDLPIPDVEGLLDEVPDLLRVLMVVGLLLLLVILRFDAERFNAAEYDDIDRWGRSPVAAAPARLVHAGHRRDLARAQGPPGPGGRALPGPRRPPRAR